MPVISTNAVGISLGAQSLIPRREQSRLPVRIAATESVSSCALVKFDATRIEHSSRVVLTSRRDVPHSPSLNGSETGGGLFPAVLRLFRTRQRIESTQRGKEGNNHMYLIRRLTPLVVIASALAWLTLSLPAQAVMPPPDGGYANFNTGEGEDALFKLTTGGYNTAVGWVSLWSEYR
jgi:hypothetical protein